MFEVLAGDIKKGPVVIMNGKVNTKSTFLKMEFTAIKSFEIITEENKKKFMGAAGWAAAGGLAFGPLGALAGVMLGGNKKEVMVAVELEDGRRFMGKCSPKEIPSLYRSGPDASEKLEALKKKRKDREDARKAEIAADPTKENFLERWERTAKENAEKRQQEWAEHKEKLRQERAEEKARRKKELDVILGRAPRE